MSHSETPPESNSAPDLLHAKLEALAEFAAGAGHEINNPLATIAGRVQLLLRDETDPERRRALLTIGGQAYRIRDMIGDAMLFGRPPQPNPEPLDLVEQLHTVLERLAELVEDRGCAIAVEAEGPVPILADRTQLAVVVSELVRNSLQALGEVVRCDETSSPESGAHVVHIAARAMRLAGRPFAALTVADRGAGLSDDEREHLFDPFYSGRQAGRGLGFGLPKAWRIVTLHGGTIEVEFSPDGETRFEVRWPADRIPSTG